MDRYKKTLKKNLKQTAYQKRPDGLMRLNKFLADSGLASRRQSDQLIENGSVQVNGKTVYELGTKVDPLHDRVVVAGQPVRPVTQRLYLAFYKPENVLTSMSDPEGRPNISDFVQDLPVRVFPVGRLDWDTEGLLLLTNDGDFAQKVAHPRAAIPKTYLAKLNAFPTQLQLEKLKKGVTIPGGKATAVHVEKVAYGDSKKYAWVKIVILEGRNRQVRKMFEKVGLDVKKLKRTAIGLLDMGHLRKGTYVFLSRKGLEDVLSTQWTTERTFVRRAPRRPLSGHSRRVGAAAATKKRK